MDIVVKIGGGLLAHPEHLDAVLAVVGTAGERRPLLIVAGGGPFADTVREVHRRFGLSDDAVHWMAVLAMDQYAHLIASRLSRGVCVSELAEAVAAGDDGRVPVLAPSRWLREVDPLPHSWDVTSDSIAAWVAGQVGASRLVLVKPPGAMGARLVDAYFERALPAGVTAIPIAADRVDDLRLALIPDLT